MDEPLRFSIVTPSFNSVHTIAETLESVARQDYPYIEHFVIDGGSTDGTLEVLKRYPKIHWISEKDEGHYHAMNKGILMASGQIVGILNADDCYCEGVLSKVATAFQVHPEWEALFGNVIVVDGSGQEILRREEAGWDPQILRSGFNNVCHQALFVRKSTYNRLGLMRHQDFKNACDYEYLLRMAKAHCRVGHIREFVVRFRYHQFGQSADKRIKANMAAETVRIQQEYGVPGGWAGKLLGYYGRVRRQVRKLLVLGKCDLIPGRWLIRKHLSERTEFSSNTRFDKL